MPPTLPCMNHRLTQRRCSHQEAISPMIWGFINPTRESRWLSQCESPRPSIYQPVGAMSEQKIMVREQSVREKSQILK